ncbi:MAG: hypothetical protein WC788_04325 [Candidatus Paceibacterota bacterium]
MLNLHIFGMDENTAGEVKKTRLVIRSSTFFYLIDMENSMI